MAGLWRFQEGKEKYLVQRRDGTVPDWPWFVLGASDPAAPAALRAYADAAEGEGFDTQYVEDLRELADQFEDWRREHSTGDPDAPRHRDDSALVIARLSEANRG